MNLLIRPVTLGASLLLGLASAVLPSSAGAEDRDLPPYQRDRGHGLPVSMFGTYIGKAELLVYPFVEYYLDHDCEYKPREFGYGLDEDFRGSYRAVEGLVFAAYGITDWLAVELEAAVIDARLEKASEDPSGVPDETGPDVTFRRFPGIPFRTP